MLPVYGTESSKGVFGLSNVIFTGKWKNFKIYWWHIVWLWKKVKLFVNKACGFLAWCEGCFVPTYFNCALVLRKQMYVTLN